MDQRLYDLHLRAGRLSGREKTCGKKTPYASEALAQQAAEAHNRWKERNHDVEPYPCAFCHQWHIGGIMPLSLLEAMTASPVNSAEQHLPIGEKRRTGIARNPFSEWLEEVAADEIAVNATDIKAECHPNLWSFSLSPEIAKAITVQDVKGFVLGVIRARAQQLQERGLPPQSTVFYTWHDEQAGQLRFSLVSSSHGYLPFGATLQKVEQVETIIGSWLNSPYLHGIPWDELEVLDVEDPGPQDEGQREPYTLQVWSTLI